MKKHTRIVMEFFGYSSGDFIPCELCGQRAVDTHHIENKGMGGNPSGDKDVIENLMSVCRRCHDLYGDKKKYIAFLKMAHASYIKTLRPWIAVYRTLPDMVCSCKSGVMKVKTLYGYICNSCKKIVVKSTSSDFFKSNKNERS